MVHTKVRYIRLLSYDNACKVIEFINKNDKMDYSHITPGGVAMQVLEKNRDKVETFIKSLEVRYEICDDHPEEVTRRIVEDLKAQEII